MDVLLIILGGIWVLIKFARSAALKRQKAASEAEQRAQAGAPYTPASAPNPVRPPEKQSVWAQITELIDEQLEGAHAEGGSWAGEGSFEGAVIDRGGGEGGWEGGEGAYAYPAQSTRMWEGEGASASDEAGCIGGTIQHDEHEGMPRSGSLDYTPTTGYAPIPRTALAEDHSTPARAILTGADARRAVVWAELLGKPVALRARQNLRGGMGS